MLTGTSESARNREGQRGVDISTLSSCNSEMRDCFRAQLLAVGLHSESAKTGVPGETRMDSDYIFLCGVMWLTFGQQDAGKELLRAADSMDPDMKALAWAMLAESARPLRVSSSETALTPGTS